jgi:peptidoglycan/LPS O-acetylase OafA/YrhL
VLGLILARSDDLLARLPRPRLLLALAVAGFAAACFLPAHEAVRLFCVYLIALFGLASDRRGLASGPVRAVAPLGRLTYSFYMLHMPISLVLISALGKHILRLEDASLNVWVVGVAVLALPLAAIASFLLFETPARRRIGGSVRSPGAGTLAP